MEWQKKVARWIESNDSSVMRLARRADIPYGTLMNALRRPKGSISAGNGLKLARAMGILMDVLFDEEIAYDPAEEETGLIPLTREEIREVFRDEVADMFVRGLERDEKRAKKAAQKRGRRKR